jgi:hypothetical protein
VRSEGDMSLKNPVTPPGIDLGTVRLVAQRLNYYATPGPNVGTIEICNYIDSRFVFFKCTVIYVGYWYVTVLFSFSLQGVRKLLKTIHIVFMCFKYLYIIRY